MKTMDRLDFREIANAKISSRLRQAAILLLAIIIGMILSVSVNAQNRLDHKKSSNDKAMENLLSTKIDNSESTLLQR